MSVAPDGSLMKRLLALQTGNVCDALAELGWIPKAMRGLKCIGNPAAFAGPAFTLRQVPRPIDAPSNVNLTKHALAIDEMAQPGEVLVIDTGGRDEACTFGAILMLRAKLRGIAGVVTDGAARDVGEIPEVGLPVYVKSANPVASKVFFQTVSVGEPISCGGVLVRPGDIVFGDATGVLVISPDQLAEVVERGEAVTRREAKWLAGVRGGRSLLQTQRES
jgi:4-hydroxy-4-methyl-2-oxoglutarate aldolase